MPEPQASWPVLPATEPLSLAETLYTLRAHCNNVVAFARHHAKKTAPSAYVRDLADAVSQLLKDILTEQLVTQHRDTQALTSVVHQLCQKLTPATPSGSGRLREWVAGAHGTPGEADPKAPIAGTHSPPALGPNWDDQRVRIQWDLERAPYVGWAPGDLRRKVQEAVNQALPGVEVGAVSVLPSGDIDVFVARYTDRERLVYNAEAWLPALKSGRKARIINNQYAILVHSVKRAWFPRRCLESGEAGKELLADNPQVPGARVLYVSWATAAQSKAKSSLIVSFHRPEDANALLRGPLFLRGEAFVTELFDPRCRVVQCHKCHQFGHVARCCISPRRCPYCVSAHEDVNCPLQDYPDRHQCANCLGPHAATTKRCPKRVALQKEAEIARKDKPKFFPMPERPQDHRPVDPPAPPTGTETPPANPQASGTPDHANQIQELAAKRRTRRRRAARSHDTKSTTTDNTSASASASSNPSPDDHDSQATDPTYRGADTSHPPLHPPEVPEDLELPDYESEDPADGPDEPEPEPELTPFLLPPSPTLLRKRPSRDGSVNNSPYPPTHVPKRARRQPADRSSSPDPISEASSTVSSQRQMPVLAARLAKPPTPTPTPTPPDSDWTSSSGPSSTSSSAASSAASSQPAPSKADLPEPPEVLIPQRLAAASNASNAAIPRGSPPPKEVQKPATAGTKSTTEESEDTQDRLLYQQLFTNKNPLGGYDKYNIREFGRPPAFPHPSEQKTPAPRRRPKTPPGATPIPLPEGAVPFTRPVERWVTPRASRRATIRSYHAPKFTQSKVYPGRRWSRRSDDDNYY